MKYASLLRQFIAQAHTDRQQIKEYNKSENGIKAGARFGQGAPSKVPLISFTKEGETTTNGIYPAYLYYKSRRILVLAYGISETSAPKHQWDLENPESIEAYFERTKSEKPDRYGSSYVFKVYDTNDLPSDEVLDADLQVILKQYEKSTGSFSAEILQENQELDLSAFKTALGEANLVFSDQLIRRYVASMLAKPFVILTGLTGSGKTKLAKSFAKWISGSDEQWCIVPVGADWTNRDPLLGYPNGLKSNEYILPETGVLQLLLRAIKNPELPYFLILDEMNLSHVERYFADFLSAMESRGEILLHDMELTDIPKKMALPENLFITGTVNIDETTYMFSPKVLDRANVIEFRIDIQEMKQFLEAPYRPLTIANNGHLMGRNFLKLAQQEVTSKPDSSITNVLVSFFQQLQEAGTEFGYRTAMEIHRLMYYLDELGIHDKDEKLDVSILQKLLPKLHGSRRKLVPILEIMAGFCVELPANESVKELLNAGKTDHIQVLQPLTFGKLKRMYRAANENGFASYAEA